MGEVQTQQIEQRHGDGPGALGRHIAFDEQSRSFAITAPEVALSQLPNRLWRRVRAPYDQGALGPKHNIELGCCTIMGLLGVVQTSPLVGRLTSAQRRKMDDPIPLYTDETTHDEFPGQYPPDDTGSSVLDAMKLAQRDGWISSYQWSFKHTDLAYGVAMVGPAEVGVYWTEGMDNPDAYGVVHPTGQDRGGHAFELLGRVTDAGTVLYIFCNSWGSSWPSTPAVKNRPGYFAMPEKEFLDLLQRDGEVAFPKAR